MNLPVYPSRALENLVAIFSSIKSRVLILRPFFYDEASLNRIIAKANAEKDEASIWIQGHHEESGQWSCGSKRMFNDEKKAEYRLALNAFLCFLLDVHIDIYHSSCVSNQILGHSPHSSMNVQQYIFAHQLLLQPKINNIQRLDSSGVEAISRPRSVCEGAFCLSLLIYVATLHLHSATWTGSAAAVVAKYRLH